MTVGWSIAIWQQGSGLVGAYRAAAFRYPARRTLRVNVGTRFLASEEAQISPVWKQKIVDAAAEDAIRLEFLNDIMPSPGAYGYGTVLRSLRTPFIDTWRDRPEEAKRNADRLLAEVIPVFKQMRVHELFPAAGQSAGLIRDVVPAGEIVRRLVTEAREAFERSSDLWG